MWKTNSDGKVRSEITSSWSPPPALYISWFSLRLGQHLTISLERKIKSNCDVSKSFAGIYSGNMAQQRWTQINTLIWWLSQTMAVLHSCNVLLQADSTRGAGGAIAGIPAKFGSFYAQSLLSACCKPCLAANLANLWWNSRTSSAIHLPHWTPLSPICSSPSSFINGRGQEGQVGSGKNMGSHF